MKVGYDKPLYILPFDHRHHYAESFGYREPMTSERVAEVSANKRVVYEAFKKSLAAGVPRDHLGVLVDEQYGTDILRDSVRNGFVTVMPTEKCGQHEFDFDFGDEFGRHIEEIDAAFAKVLVRHNPEGDAAMNQRQMLRLKQLSDYCHAHDRSYMFELIMPPEPAQLEKLGGDKAAFDLELRPELMVRAMHEIQDFGIEPDVWKIEGFDREEDCARVAGAARRDGRDEVGCIVLGRGEDERKVTTWLQTAASVPGFIGFAVGRSTFVEPLAAYRAQKITADAASTEIARRFQRWIEVFETARAEAVR